MRFRTWLRGKERDNDWLGGFARDVRSMQFNDLPSLVGELFRANKRHEYSTACGAWIWYLRDREAGK